jgi:hypothetical protein
LRRRRMAVLNVEPRTGAARAVPASVREARLILNDG